MIKGERITIKLFPVLFKDKRSQLFELRRSRIWCQDLEITVARVHLVSKLNCVSDALFRVLQEADDIKTGSRDLKVPAKLDHVSHVLMRNNASSDLAQHG